MTKKLNTMDIMPIWEEHLVTNGTGITKHIKIAPPYKLVCFSGPMSSAILSLYKDGTLVRSIPKAAGSAQEKKDCLDKEMLDHTEKMIEEAVALNLLIREYLRNEDKDEEQGETD